ncbi:hypothetical protein GCM10023323_06510 [Streptomyces thinghirensis]|uniref:Uncharacterized protein n=2 Tax=Streptomyces thinghirensis TaxID=551547 RepID=A0ABP9SYZ8_9ACTN
MRGAMVMAVTRWPSADTATMHSAVTASTRKGALRRRGSAAQASADSAMPDHSGGGPGITP